MSSSIEELFNTFKSLSDMGMVGVIPDLQEERNCKVVYNKIATLNQVVSPKEFRELPLSQNMEEAVKSGLKNDEEIIEYGKQKTEIKKEEAIKRGEAVICDTIGMFSCKDSHEECSWDMVYEVVTPNGDCLYLRKHCY